MHRLSSAGALTFANALLQAFHGDRSIAEINEENVRRMYGDCYKPTNYDTEHTHLRKLVKREQRKNESLDVMMIRKDIVEAVDGQIISKVCMHACLFFFGAFMRSGCCASHD